MQTEDGRYTIAYNGEVYNYLELRAELEALGHSFATDSDTEVVLEAFAAVGRRRRSTASTACSALAIWDSEKQAPDPRPRPLRHQAALRLPGSRCRPGRRRRLALRQRDQADPGQRPLRASAPTTARIYRYLRFRIHEDGRPRPSSTASSGSRPGEMVTISARRASSAACSPRLREELAELAHGAAPLRRRRRRRVQVAPHRGGAAAAAVRGPGRHRRSPVASTSRRGGHHQPAASTTATATTESVGARQNTFSAVFPGSVNDEERYVDDVLDICRGHVARPQDQADARRVQGGPRRLRAHPGGAAHLAPAPTRSTR